MGWQPLPAGEAWSALGGGVGSYGLALYASGSLQVGRHGLISVRWAGTSDLDQVNDAGFFSGESFCEGAYDIGILLGWVIINDQKRSSISASVGVGRATITERGDWIDNWLFPGYWDKEQQTTTGFLLQSQLFVKRFGIQAFADFNSVRSFAGMVVSFRFLRPGSWR